MDLISIIVPVYNTQDYVKKCICSILNQTYKNLELILVDDGSTDGSGAICEHFAQVDGRVKVFHKVNGGNISARKAGLRNSNGSYIMFVDSDDWVEASTAEILLGYLRKYQVDMVCGGISVDTENTTAVIKNGVHEGKYEVGVNYETLIRNMIYVQNSEEQGIYGWPGNKLYKKTLIEPVLLDLKNELQYGEDRICAYASILKANSVYICTDHMYHYVMREDSIVHSLDDRYYIRLNLMFLKLREIFEHYPRYHKFLIPQLGKLMANLVIEGINNRFDFGIDVSIPYYVCPLEKILPGGKIVLYGAGKLGKSYYSQLCRAEGVHIAGWIDKESDTKQNKICKIESPDQLKEMDYDFVLLAAMKRGTAESMKKELLRQGVEESKILWEPPKSILQIEGK